MLFNEEQESEILALSSIYIDTFKEVEPIIGDEYEDLVTPDDDEGEYTGIYQIVIRPDINLIKELNDDVNSGFKIDVNYDYDIYFKFKYSKLYPSSEQPIISIKSTWIHGSSDQSILRPYLNDLWNSDELVIFQMVSWLQENSISTLNNHYKSSNSKKSNYHELKKQNSPPTTPPLTSTTITTTPTPSSIKTPTIYTSQPIVEKKSKFIAHLAVVHSQEEVDLVLEKLKSFKKIYEATHNMYAYRYQLDNGEIDEYYNDDGEDGAGQNIQHLLSKNQTKEILIVVSRWFGGILLGGRRYLIITKISKDILNLYQSNQLSQCSLEYN